MEGLFGTAFESYGNEVKAALTHAVAANAQTEEQLKAPTISLFERLANGLGFPISARPEARMSELSVRPDLGVLVRGSLCGHIELKAPGMGANPERLKDPRNREQWRRLQGHPNLIYTDGNEWGLFRDGERLSLVKPGGDVATDGSKAYSPRDIERLEALLRNFLSWQPIVPGSPKALAGVLAPLCRLLRADVLDALSNPHSRLVDTAGDWREVLFPNADDAQFADAYAQTMTYALLLARLQGEADMQVQVAAAKLRKGHALLSRALNALGDPDITDEIGMSVDLLQRVITAVDPDKIQRGDADPWLYFYEDFLAAYDPELRKNRGVYYTPVEVVRAQVNLVSSLLRDRFHKPLSFADDGVSFLDPAVGTGTYLLAAIDHALGLVEKTYGEGARAARASTLAQNMHAFEILVGPYAVAHLRLTQSLLAAKGELPQDGVHVYLTDTLESPYAKPEEWHVAFNVQLSEEHRNALVVKRDTPILVCLGNPPYDRQTIAAEEQGHVHRKGGWVVFGDGDHEPLLQDFIRTLSPEDRVHAKNLYNDYVYFWRWALWKAFEASPDKPAGIVSFITAASYLRGPWAKGMRELMRRTCDEIWVIDLEGGNLGPRKTENVFAIQNPVAIAVCVRYGEPSPETPARVSYTRVSGTRDEKLAAMNQVQDFDDLPWTPCGSGWQEPFVPEGEGQFFELPLLNDLFPWQHTGVETKRPWVIGESPSVLTARWNGLVGVAAETRASYVHETRDRKVGGVYPPIWDEPSSTPISSLPASTAPPTILPFAYRVLDRQYLLADSRLLDYARPVLWDTMGPRQLFLTSLSSTPLGAGPALFATSTVPDRHHFRGSYGGKDTIPLWRDAAATNPNLNLRAIAYMDETLGTIRPEDFFAYTYALLVSPSYVERFSEELLYSQPRVPITKNRELFDKAASLGRQLIWLHTFGERLIPVGKRKGTTPQGRARSTKAIPQNPTGYPDSNPTFDPETQTVYFGEGEFAPVSQDVWDYEVSGYHVAQAWLKSRRRSGSGKKSSPLDDIRPTQWTAEMTEEFLRLLWIIEATISMHAGLEKTLDAVLADECFKNSELPEPRVIEQKPPEKGVHEQHALDF